MTSTRSPTVAAPLLISYAVRSISDESPAASRDTDASDGEPDTPVSGPGSPLTVTPKGAFTPDDLDSPHFSASAPRRTSLAPKEPAKNNWVPGQPGGM